MTTITTHEVKNQSRAVKVGWGILLVVSAMLLFNGIAWFFLGPEAERGDLGALEFSQLYPEIADQMGKNAQQVAIWYMAFGSLALLVALQGFWNGSRWAWYALWVMIAALVAVGMLYVGGFGAGLLVLAVVALIGMFLARKGLAQ
ncbi:MAG TPA: hypothetical protein PLD25_26760 [Chloroflexota bacterium]|nr:hypothetical protein [Chloroflexota bacterium]HUM67496.1 hypothetical protein [Chloroflexota bacterium]